MQQKLLISFCTNELGLSIRNTEILQKWLWRESRLIDCDSSRVILWGTLLESSQVKIFFIVTRAQVAKNRFQSFTRITLSLAKMIKSKSIKIPESRKIWIQIPVHGRLWSFSFILHAKDNGVYYLQEGCFDLWKW